ncbi:MAG: hypothetical protein KGR18_06230 [Acidobacteria bacterium]|nr:hypothetical protein [Acidobacteriota bacterium]
MATLIRYALLLATTAVLQRLLLDQIRIADVAADGFLVLSVATGVVAGSRRGAVVGFAAGLALDLMVLTPFGLGALSSLVAGAVAGSLERLIVHSARTLTLAVGFASAFVGVLFFVLVGSLLGGVGLVDGHLPVILLLVPATTAVLVLPVRRLIRWAEAPSRALSPALR